LLSATDNETLTRVGPGTPMGNVMREHWLPTMAVSEAPGPDGDPMRVRLLGEDLILFRDTAGRLGLLANSCSHRGASLFYGRNEDGGLRCVYHGWKYDVTGQCVDMPSEPAESNFKDKVRQRAYPCVEYGSMVWSYMGPRKTPPELPQFEWAMVPETHRTMRPFLRECNYMQALEGDIDSSHLYHLHSRLNPDDLPSYGVYHADKHPRLEVMKTDYGVVYGANREEDEHTSYWRVTQFMLPIFTYFPPSAADGTVPGHIWVPLDDTHTMVWILSWNPLMPMKDTSAFSRVTIPERPVGEYLAPTTQALSRWKARANASNDYGIDRKKQRTQNYTGISAIQLQDQAVVESMGDIYDRTQEHLGTSDGMIIQVRRKLLETARLLAEDGVIPPCVDNPALYHVRSGAATMPKGTLWYEHMKAWLNAWSTEVMSTDLVHPR
jgi:phthalate 4,5-dioxygenase oxygenase subunit